MRPRYDDSDMIPSLGAAALILLACALVGVLALTGVLSYAWSALQ